MKTVTIGFSKSSKKFPLFSWLIMWAQKTPYSHAYIKFHKEDIDRDVYYQASHSMVNFMSSNQFNSEEILIQEFQFEMEDCDSVQMNQEMYDQLGKPYGVTEIFGLALVLICSWVGITINNPIKDGATQFYCSELVSYFLSRCEGIILPKDIEDMTPKDLYNFVQILPTKLKLKS